MQSSYSKIPLLVLAVYLMVFIATAINPYDRATWWAENIPIWIVVFGFVVTFSRFQFSNFAYILTGFFLCYHTIGGYFTFELVPFDWGNAQLSTLNFDFLLPDGRNNFDRLGHFLVGVFAYPFVEISLRKAWVNKPIVAVFFAVFALGFWAGTYEIIEMYYAVIEGGESGVAFLGSQGDIWDAQKDMLMDILGALLFAVWALVNRRFFLKLPKHSMTKQED